MDNGHPLAVFLKMISVCSFSLVTHKMCSFFFFVKMKDLHGHIDRAPPTLQGNFKCTDVLNSFLDPVKAVRNMDSAHINSLLCISGQVSFSPLLISPVTFLIHRLNYYIDVPLP